MGAESSEPKAPPPNSQDAPQQAITKLTTKEAEVKDVENVLKLFGLPESSARRLAWGEFFKWEPEELAILLSTVDGLRDGLKSFDSDDSDQTGVHDAMPSYWIKAPEAMITASARDKMALCVNEKGEWMTRSKGYGALSHVWSEGTHGDSENRGVPRHIIQQIFHRISQLGVEWIWMDSLAIPGGSRALSVHEEKIKVDLINSMASIYENADMVIVLDALVMRLAYGCLEDIAVALLCGKWVTRIWTYQEIKLAKTVMIITKRGTVNFTNVLDRVRYLAGVQMATTTGMESVFADEYANKKYRNLYHTLKLLRRSFPEKPSLVNIVESCSHRNAGFDLDYARAFFPILGLQWEEGLTREEGMERIYRSQLYYAKELILMYGSPRSNVWPGWAPSYLHNLTGVPLKDVVWEPRGLKKDWYTYKLRSHQPKPPQFENKPTMIVEIDEGGPQEYVCICEYDVKETEKTKTNFQNAISKGMGFILADSPLQYVRHSGQYALCVEQCSPDYPQEAYVCFVSTVLSIKAVDVPTQLQWTISHINPTTDYSPYDRGADQFGRETSRHYPHAGEQDIHKAAYLGDLARLESLLQDDQVIEARDALGCTALHAAAHKGHEHIVEALLYHGANVDALDRWKQTPLMFAAENCRTNTTLRLLEAGADVNFSSQNLSALSEAIMAPSAGNIDTVKVLLDHGARANDADDMTFTPLFHAVKNVALVDLLLAYGAKPAKRISVGFAPIHNAARHGYADSIKRLIEAGCPVDLPERNFSPLACAVEEQKEGAVRVLIQHGADVDWKLDGNRTLLILATKSGHYSIVEQLFDAGARVDVRCEPEGWTALHIAVQYGHYRITKLLLSGPRTGFILQIRDAADKTPLDLAIAKGNDEIVDLLLTKLTA